MTESAAMPAPTKKKRNPHPSGPSGPSGQHRAARRPISASAEQLARWDAQAARAGLTWAAWARALMDGGRATGGLAEPQEGPFPERRLLSASDAQWRAWTAKAARAGLAWADWVRRLQDGAA